MAAPGEREREQLRGAGFSDPELSEWEARTRRELSEAGFGNREVDEYFGIKQPDPAAVRGIVEQNLAAPVDVEAPAVAVTPPPLVPVPAAATPQQRAVLETFPGQLPFTPPPKPPAKPAADFTGQKPPPSLLEMFEAGLGMSVSGLFAGGLPDEVLPEDASAAASIAYMAGMTIGDIPPMIVGGILGAAGGTAVAGPGIGSAVGMGAGSLALPEALRTTYIEQAKKGEVQSAKDFLNRTLAVLWATLKGGILGGGTVGAGRAAGAATAAFRPAIQTTAELSAEAAAVAVLSRGLEGQLPQPKDFSDAAVLVFGMRGAAAGASKLMDIYAKTGVRPEQIVEHARNEPTVMQDLLSNKEVPTAYEPLLGKPVEAAARPEPVAAPAALTEASSVLRPDTKVEPVLGRPVDPPLTREPGVRPPMSLAEARAEIASKTAIGAETPRKPYTFDDLIRDYVDANAPLNDAFAELTRRTGTQRPTFQKPSADIGFSEDVAVLVQNLAGMAGRGKHFVEYGVVDHATGRVVAPSLKQALEPVKDQLDDFRYYLLAKHSLEATTETGISRESAEVFVRENAGRYDRSASAFTQYLNNTLTETLVKSGIVGDTVAQEWFRKYGSFVNLKRLFEPNKSGYQLGAGLTVRNPVKTRTGSDAVIIDPIQTAIENTYRYVELAERNRVVGAFVAQLEKLPDGQGADIGVLKARGTHPIKLSTSEIDKLTKMVGDELGVDIPSGVVEQFTVFRPDAFNPRTNELVLFRNGAWETWEVNPAIAEVFRADPTLLGPVARLSAEVTGLAKAGIVLRPEFPLANAVVDSIVSFVFARGIPASRNVPFVPFARGVYSTITKDEAYQRFLRGGGAISGMQESALRDFVKEEVDSLTKSGVLSRAWNLVKTPQDLPKAVADLTAYTSKHPGRAALNVATSPVVAIRDTLRGFSQFFETATRVGNADRMFKTLREKGVPEIDALYGSANFSRDMMDFMKAGAAMRAINLHTMFANVWVRGWDKLQKEMIADPVGTSVRAFAGITVPSLLLWWANKDDPRIQEAAPWVKDHYWQVPVRQWELVLTPEGQPVPYHEDIEPYPGGYFRRGVGPDGEPVFEHDAGPILRFRKPFEPGVFFGSFVERFMDDVMKDDPQAWAGLGQTLAALGLDVVPTLPAPVIEHIANKSFFTGGSLVPGYMEGDLPEYQYLPYTSSTAKLVGQTIAGIPGLKRTEIASPILIENYVRAWSGGIGMYILQVLDQSLHASGVVPEPVKPTATLADIPFVKGFAVRYPSANTASIQRFYDRHYEKEQVVKTVQRLAKEGDMAAALREAELDPTAFARLDATREALTNTNKAIQMIWRNPSMSPDEKRQLIDTLYYYMIGAAREGNKQLDEVDRMLK